MISGHHHRETLNGIDTGPSLPEHTKQRLGKPTHVNFWCMMPKILIEMKNVGKYLRATHHLYFQTSFLRRTVDKNVFAGVPCKKIALAKFKSAYLFQNPRQKSCDYILIRRCAHSNCIELWWAPDSGEKTPNDKWLCFIAASNIELMKSDNFLRWVTDISWSADKTMNVGSSLCLFICIYTQINKFKQE